MQSVPPHTVQGVFPQTVIAVMWDFDKTLIPGYMQTPLFTRFGVAEGKFWQEVQGLAAHYRKHGVINVSTDTVYLNHILAYVRAGIFRNLSNQLLFDLGAKLEFYPGIPEFFGRIRTFVEDNPAYAKFQFQVEHYIISTGLAQMIRGSAIAPHVRGIWGCEFVEYPAQPDYLDPQTPLQRSLFDVPELRDSVAMEVVPIIRDIAYVIDNTTKTRAVFEINKGTNIDPEIDVNARMKPEARRVSFKQMIYIADGPSDVPVFSLLNQYGGRTFAVFTDGSSKGFRDANYLQKEGRVQAYGPANYVETSLTSMWILNSVDEIAMEMLAEREWRLQFHVGHAPRHSV